MLSLTLGSNNNTNSPPFYEYNNNADVLYVGDDGGRLWKVTGVFLGTPTIATGNWANGVVVHNGSKLTGPVVDFGTGNILVGDSGGQLNCVTSTGSLCATSNLSLNNAITDPPIVDSSAETVYAFVGGSGSASTVKQATTSLGSPLSLTVGSDVSSGSQIHSGMFDNNYYNTGTGNLWVCGKGGSSDPGPELYYISVAPGTFSLGNNGAALLSLTTTATTAAQCSPLEELYNPNQGGGTDWLFVGVPGDCEYGTSTTGCVMSFQIGNASGSAIPTTAFSAPLETNGTSGIIADNVSTTSQASSLYFVTLGSPSGGCTNDVNSDASNCLVKVTQAGLQ
jgi:hypothetical protein